MKLADVPDLAAFEQHALARTDCPITQDTYMAVLSLVQLLEKHAQPVTETGILRKMSGHQDIEYLTRQCAVIEESSKLIWACAAVTGFIHPPLWTDHVPTLEEALDYFHGLQDGEWMALTHHYRIRWGSQAASSDQQRPA